MFIIDIPSSVLILPLPKEPSISHFPDHTAYTLLISYILPPKAPILTIVSFCFPDVCIFTGWELTSENLELGFSNKREHVTFVFLGMGYLTQYDLF